MLKNKKGVSLMVLIITMVVLAILVGAVIMQSRSTRTEKRAEEAKFKQSISSFLDELDMYMSNQKIAAAEENRIFTVDDIDAENDEAVNAIITSIVGTEYEGKFLIVDGKLQIKEGADFTSDEQTWFSEVN